MAPHVKSTSSLAFNVALVAYDYDYPDRIVNQHLVVKKLSKKEVIALYLKANDVEVPNIEPSRAELNGDAESSKAIWVGMRPGIAGDYVKRSSSGQAKGASVAKNKGYKSISTDKNALRVVAPLGKANANYYSLVNQDEDGLCTGYHTPIEEVFFFPEFRDDEVNTYDLRKAVFGGKVRTALNGTQRVTSKEYDMLKKALEMVDYVNGEESSGLVHARVWVDRLITTTEPLELCECGEILTQLQVLAPEIMAFEVKAEEVKHMSKGMCEAGIALEYDFLRPFVMLFISSLSQTEGGNLKDMALVAEGKAIHLLGPVPM